MANIRKTFNFRNGVQVDDDDLIVRGDLVGIGTTIPTERLDVRGNTNVVGFVTSSELFVSGVSTFFNTIDVKSGPIKVGTGITIDATSGIITATKVFGDGSTLSNLPTSQWVDTDVGLGFTSIYAAGNVGVGTTDPRHTLQIGGNNDAVNFVNGVGFSSEGNIQVTGVSTFIGVGTFGTSLNVANDFIVGNRTTLGGGTTISGQLDTSNINSSGVVTATTFAGNLTGTPTLGTGVTVTSSGLELSGSVTAAQFVGPLTGNITGNIVGNITGDITGNVTGSLNSVGVSTIVDANITNLSVSGVTTSPTIHSGSGGTGFAALSTGKIGVGTALPTSEIQVRKASGSLVEVVAETGESRISIGQSVGVGKSTGTLRFGNATGVFDVINNDIGNLNLVLHAGPSGVGTGRFGWVYGQNNSELMSLTHTGSLGLGVQNPVNTLHVVGTSTVTSNAFVGGDLTVAGSINGTINFPAILAGTNLHNTSGISTFNNVRAVKIGIQQSNPLADVDCFAGTGIFGGVGIGTTNPKSTFDVRGTSIFEKVGVGTTGLYTGLPDTGNAQVHGTRLTVWNNGITVATNDAESRIGLGTHRPQCAVDFSRAGTGAIGAAGGFMMVPLVTSTVRDNFNITPAGGAVIYNTTTNKLQCHNGSGWQDLF
jgi:hypothetical protein